MKRLIIILTFFISAKAFGQYYADIEIPRGTLRPWNVKSTQEYCGTYKFGISEGECELRLFVYDTIVIAQTSCYTIDPNSTGFRDTFKTFSNVSIKGNKFFSNQTNGEFVIYASKNGTKAGLYVYSPWTDKINNGGEFGSILPDDEGVYLVGDYPLASTKILIESELEKYSIDQLKIMRNEIFARYGLIFQQSGQMEKYFTKQKWYHKNYDKVDQWLTKIELKNIETILKTEKNKNGL